MISLCSWAVSTDQPFIPCESNILEWGEEHQTINQSIIFLLNKFRLTTNRVHQTYTSHYFMFPLNTSLFFQHHVRFSLKSSSVRPVYSSVRFLSSKCRHVFLLIPVSSLFNKLFNKTNFLLSKILNKGLISYRSKYKVQQNNLISS